MGGGAGRLTVQTREANFEMLLLKAKEVDRVPVVIRFDLNGILGGRVPAEILSTPLPRLSPVQEDALLKAINDAQTVLLESLQGKGEVGSVKRMKYSPSLAFTADRRILFALRENPNVLNVYEDGSISAPPAE